MLLYVLKHVIFDKHSFVAQSLSASLENNNGCAECLPFYILECSLRMTKKSPHLFFLIYVLRFYYYKALAFIISHLMWLGSHKRFIYNTMLHSAAVLIFCVLTHKANTSNKMISIVCDWWHEAKWEQMSKTDGVQ